MRLCSTPVIAFAFVAAGVFAPFSATVSLGAESAAKAAVSPAEAQAQKDEIEYIRALVNANMPDFAAPVIAAARKKWPSLGPKLKVLELQGALSLGRFDVVQKAVDAIADKKSADYWALRLSMADAYFARSMMPECRKIYKEFFAAVPKPGEDLLEFYVESAFKWAQILEREKLYDEAVRVYDGLLAQPLPEERWCAIAMQNTELLIRLAAECTDPKQAKKRADYLTKATQYADKLLWKNELIIVFGKAISMKAHIEMLRGNLEKAQGLVTSYMPQLAEIHRSLTEQDPDGSRGYVRMSPMPECRYLLAKLMWEGVREEAKKAKANEDLIKDSLFGARAGGKRNGAGAYNHAINVFVKYPESSWAGEAGELAESIAKFVKTRYKKEIKTNISKNQMKKVRLMQFQNAYEVYRSGDYKKAVASYREILSRFPELEESIDAVANLADSYLNLWQSEKNESEKKALRMETDAVEGYLAERFSGAKPAGVRNAGERVLSLAAKEHDAGALARSQNLFDLYFKCYPTHYNAAQMALSLAGKAYKAEDWEKAIHYYGMIATSYTNSAYYVNALQALAACNGKIGDTDAQMDWLRKFSLAAKRPSERLTAQLSLALMQQKRGFAAFETASETNDTAAADALCKEAYRNVAGAIRDFRGVASGLTKVLETKGLSKEEKDRFLLQREQAVYLEGESWQRLTYPKDKVPAFRAQAVKAYERYLEVAPKGRYAPQILVKIGTIHTAEKNMDASQQAFSRLQKDFPDSDEAKNSVPRLAKTLIEMGLRAEGVAEYKQMLATPGGKYTAGQFLAAGDALLDAKGWDVAQEAYTKAIELAGKATNAVGITARAALGQAKAYYGAQAYAEAHQKLDTFIEKYGKSLLVIDAYEMLIRVASEEGRKEKDDDLRMKFFNQAVGALKKVRAYRKTQADQDLLDLRSGDVLVRKMEAEDAMNLKEQAKETCGRAVVTFQAFLMAHEPTAEHPAKDMTPAQLANLERCYATVLPLMSRLGKTQNEMIRKYGNTYLELFPDGKHKVAVQSAINQAAAD